MANENRYDRLLAWFAEHHISFEDLGGQLDISASGARRLCNAETIPVERHAQLLRLGVPEALLPVARDRRRGRPKLPPFFPGLVGQASIVPVASRSPQSHRPRSGQNPLVSSSAS